MGLGHTTPLEIDGNTILEINYLSGLGYRLWKAPALVKDVSQGISRNEVEWVL